MPSPTLRVEPVGGIASVAWVQVVKVGWVVASVAWLKVGWVAASLLPTTPLKKHALAKNYQSCRQ